MVWKDTFDPGQVRSIEVEYGIAVPLQKNSIVRRKEVGNYKGIWQQEANNMPLHFLASLPGFRKSSSVQSCKFPAE